MARKNSGGVVETANAAGEAVVQAAPSVADMHKLPWAMWLGAAPLAEVDHLVFGSSPWAAAGSICSTAALSGVTWAYASKRSPKMRAHATTTAALTGVWLTAAGITGLVHPWVPVLDWLWAFGGATLAATWNIKHALRNTGRNENADPHRSLLEMVGLSKAKVYKQEVSPNRVTLGIEAPPGGEASEILAARGPIAAHVGVGANMVRASVDPEHNGRAVISITPLDVLKASPKWEGPSKPGGTMKDPMRVGVYEDGAPLLVYGAADPEAGRNLEQMLQVGMSGSGKGIGGRALISEVGTRREVSVVMIDLAKGRQTYGCADDGGVFHRFITEKADAVDVVNVLQKVIKARTDYLASKGLDNWVPGCGLTFLIIWIEEMPTLARDRAKLVDAVAAARSGGVWIIGSLQRPSFDNIPTSVRANFGQLWTFGVKDRDEAALVVDEQSLAAGVDPSIWQARKPGYNYLVAGGVDEARHLIPARTYGEPFAFRPQALTDHLKQYANVRDEMDDVTAAAGGKAFARTSSGLYVPAGVPAARRAEITAAAPANDEERDDFNFEDVDLIEGEFDDEDYEEDDMDDEETPRAAAGRTPAALPARNDWAALDEDDDEEYAELSDDDREELDEITGGLPRFASEEPDVAELAVRIGMAELPEAPVDLIFGGDKPKLSKEEAEAAVLKALRAMAAAGTTRFSPKELGAIGLKIGRSGGWIRTYIGELVDRGVVEQVSFGIYEIASVPEPV